MRARDVWDIERDFAAAFVSNPGAGEIVKVHALALAELGLAGFYGTVVRDPASLQAAWTMERRKEHIVTRLAFVREALTRFGVAPLVLYRAISAEGPLDARRPRTLLSANADDRATWRAWLEGRLVAMEVKADAAPSSASARHLTGLRDRFDESFVADLTAGFSVQIAGADTRT